MYIRIQKSALKLLAGLLLTVGLFMLLFTFVDVPSTDALFELHHTGLNLWAVFLTGLMTGGLTCLAVQGGLLATTIAQREEERLRDHAAQKDTVLPIVSFLTAKLVAYTVLGFLLGLFGSLFKPSLFAMGILQLTVSIFMVGTALNMLNVHPVFRYFVLQPPKKLTRMVRNKAKSNDIFTPMLLGALTVFIPCGTTQAMMALAISSADPLTGTLILFAFTLGTTPLFFLLGYFTTKLSQSLHALFMRFAAVVIIGLALFMINNALMLVESPLAPAKLFAGNPSAPTTVQTTALIEINASGYSPSALSLKAGEEVILRLKNTDGYGCQQAFYIPQLEISRTVPPGTEETLTFTAPSEKGKITFMCSMGMYWGVMNIL